MTFQRNSGLACQQLAKDLDDFRNEDCVILLLQVGDNRAFTDLVTRLFFGSKEINASRCKYALQVLDLFCGMGGWSVGFHRAGFDCSGVDITDVGYPYEFIHTDIRDYHTTTDERWDVVVASPPCTEFSRLKTLYGHGSNRKEPAHPAKGIELVKEAKRVIDEAQPRFWLIENVGGAQPYFQDFLGSPKFVRRPFYLWGKFPQFLLDERDYRKPGMQHYDKKGPGHVKFNPMISWLRARIPTPLSLSLAAACQEALTRN